MKQQLPFNERKERNALKFSKMSDSFCLFIFQANFSKNLLEIILNKCEGDSDAFNFKVIRVNRQVITEITKGDRIDKKANA